MKIAIVGDVHGKIKQMYESILDIETKRDINIDTIIQIGDFQAIRNKKDLQYLAVPGKHKDIGDFPDFHKKGEVPKKTFFIGGNHENDHWLSKYHDGKEIIKNLSYLGRSGVREINGLKIGWVSGNYSSKGYTKERKKIRYHHFTMEDTQKILDEGRNIDVLLFHDWPCIRMLNQGVIEESISHQDMLEQAIIRSLGNVELYDVLRKIKPSYIFSGHMHMPLSLEKKLDDSNVRFIGLNKFDRPYSICILDTDTFEVEYIEQNGRI